VTGHVLKKSSSEDRIAIKNAIDAALKVLPTILDGELQKAMNQLHTQSS
jgi:PTH1 family peptidyl-tRNA hydrolase